MDFSLKFYRGVGPAGQVIRLIQSYSIALLKKETFIIDQETASWWQSCFDSCFYQIDKVEQKYDLNQHLKEVEQNKAYQELLIETAGKVLVLKSYLRSPFDFSYKCIYRRGTDKITETCYYPGILFKKLYDKQDVESFPLVLVSDSQYCIDELKTYYPEALTTKTIKSQNEAPIHLHFAITPQQLLRDCLLDCLVLSKSFSVIYSHSMMINLAKLFNPTLKCISVESIVDEELRQILDSCTAYLKHRVLK